MNYKLVKKIGKKLKIFKFFDSMYIFNVNHCQYSNPQNTQKLESFNKESKNKIFGSIQLLPTLLNKPQCFSLQ